MTGVGNDFAHVGLGSPNITNLVSLVAGPPSITSISPSSGPIAGGTAVTINGNAFIGVSGVSFAGTPVAAYLVYSESKIIAISPPCPVGSACDRNSTATGADITVSTPAGLGTTPPGGQFSYLGAITGITPNSGPMAGGTTVTVTGDGFRPGFNQAFRFGGIPAVNAQCSSTTQCTMGTPAAPAPGPLDVTYGGWPNGPAFIYLGPGITDVIPSSGSENGGDIVTILGRGFSNNMTLMFGAVPISGFSCSSDGTWCDLTSPPGTGQVDITFTVNGLTSARNPRDVFTYQATPFGSMSPTVGLETGGTIVTITGGNFSAAPGGTSFTFNFPGTGGQSAQASNVKCASTSQCTFTNPPWDPQMIGDLSPVTATVNGVTGRLGEFTYAAPLPPPGTLLGIGLDQYIVPYGQSDKGVVQILAPEKPEAVTVALRSDRPSLAAVPQSVTIPAGATFGSFTITTSTPPAPPPRFESVNITASLGGTSRVRVFLCRGSAAAARRGRRRRVRGRQMLMFTVRMGFDLPRLGSGTGVTDFASVAGRLAI